MGFLDWMKRRNQKPVPEPENDPAPHMHFSAKGNPIQQNWGSKWHSADDGLHKFKHHVGRSIEGFHGGLEVSFRGGETSFQWSDPRPTPDSAEKASYRMRDVWERGDDPIASFDAGREHHDESPRGERAVSESDSGAQKTRPGRAKVNGHDRQY